MTTLLLVDDSDTVLAYEQAALGADYVCIKASNGREALERLRSGGIDAVLLDLSMPELDGEHVLEIMQQTTELREVPVIICSSEEQRAHQMLEKGARAAVVKPFREDALRAIVGRVLEAHERAKHRSAIATLPVRIAQTVFGIPLAAVRAVELIPRTTQLGVGTASVVEVVDFHGELVPVLDVSRVLRLQHALPMHERKLVIIRDEARLVAFAVDAVHDPVELMPEQVKSNAELVGDRRLTSRALQALAATDGGVLPIVDPTMFFSRAQLHQVRRALVPEPSKPASV